MPAADQSGTLAIRVELGAIFVSLELSKSTWLVTALSPGTGEKMSRHTVVGGDIAGLFTRLIELRDKAQARTGKLYPMVVVQEAGLDGYWVHRSLDRESWIESHIVDASSIAVSRKRRRAKTDKLNARRHAAALANLSSHGDHRRIGRDLHSG